MTRSLRSRLLLASLLWTGGLLMVMHLVSLMVIHTVPSVRMGSDHAGLPVLIGLSVMVGGVATAWAALRPLLGLKQKIQDVRSGHASRVDGRYPTEVQPLIDGVNSLLSDREQSVTRAYSTAGDLAHSLKTPLALLQRAADDVRAAGDHALADAIAQQVTRMTTQVDYHLLRSRMAASTTTGVTAMPLAPAVEGVMRAVGRIYADRNLSIAAEVAAALQVRVRPEDLDEIVGNLIDNACKWTRHRVLISASSSSSGVAVVVDDDGPGLPVERRDAVLQRGVRLDESAPGSGLGLAIVRDLTQLYGGSIELGESRLGGLTVRVTLPGS